MNSAAGHCKQNFRCVRIHPLAKSWLPTRCLQSMSLA
jgi:hypothetical protein